MRSKGAFKNQVLLLSLSLLGLCLSGLSASREELEERQVVKESDD